MARNVVAMMALAMEYERQVIAAGTHPIQKAMDARPGAAAEWVAVFAAPSPRQTGDLVRERPEGP